MPALLLGHCAQDLGGLPACDLERPRGFELRLDPADRRRELGMARSECLVGLLALHVGADQQFAQPDDAFEAGARLREPFGAEDSLDARLVFGEQGAERLLAQGDGADRALAVAVQVTEVVEVTPEFVQGAAGLEQVVATDDLAEHGPDAVEGRLDAYVECLVLDVQFSEQAPAGVRRAHQLLAQLGVCRCLRFESCQDGVVNRRPERGEVGCACGLECEARFILGLAAWCGGGFDAGEDRPLKLVERGGQAFGRPGVRCRCLDWRLRHCAQQRTAAFGNLVGRDSQQCHREERNGKPRGDAEPPTARNARRHAAPAAGDRRRPSEL